MVRRMCWSKAICFMVARDRSGSMREGALKELFPSTRRPPPNYEPTNWLFHWWSQRPRDPFTTQSPTCSTGDHAFHMWNSKQNPSCDCRFVSFSIWLLWSSCVWSLLTGTCSYSSSIFLGNCPFLLSVWNDLLNYPVLLKSASSSITVVTVNMVHGCSAFSFLVIFKFLYSKIHNFLLTVGSCAKIIDPWFLVWRFVLFTLRVFWVWPLQ